MYTRVCVCLGVSGSGGLGVARLLMSEVQKKETAVIGTLVCTTLQLYIAYFLPHRQLEAPVE